MGPFLDSSAHSKLPCPELPSYDRVYCYPGTNLALPGIFAHVWLGFLDGRNYMPFNTP